MQAEAGALSGSGVGVRTDLAGYEGSGFVGSFTAAGDRAAVSFTNVVAGTPTFASGITPGLHAGERRGDRRRAGVGALLGTGWGWGIKTLRGVTLTANQHRRDPARLGLHDVDYLEIVP